MIYDNPEDFNAATSAGATTDADPAAKFVEEPWAGHRLRGQGLPGGDPGWHLVYHRSEDGSRGWLIGYEYAEDSKTGRILLVRDDWTEEKDRSARRIAGANFETLFRNRVGVGEANVDYVDRIIG